jgi:hypothetical protein
MAKTATYSLINSQTLGSNTASVTFSSIPATFTDLIMVINSYSTTGAGIYTQLNGDTGTNYSFTYLQGNGTAASSGRSSTQASIYLADQSSSSANLQTTLLQFNDYSNATTYKTVISRGSSASQSVTAVVGLWRSTATINQIVLLNGNFASGSVFKLYGIQAGSN